MASQQLESFCGGVRDSELDYQHVITMSLEKISSERRRKSGANLHRSLMICDLLVRLRARVLATEGAEVRPTVQQSDDDDKSHCSAAHDVQSQQPSNNSNTSDNDTDWEVRLGNSDCETSTESSSVETTDRLESCARPRCEARKKRRYSMANEADKRCRLVPESGLDDSDSPQSGYVVSAESALPSVPFGRLEKPANNSDTARDADKVPFLVAI